MEAFTNHTTVRIDRAPRHMQLICENGCTPFLIGEPGIGKTSVCGEFANIVGAEKFFVVIACLRDRLDIIGLPRGVTDPDLGNVTEYAPDKFFAELSKQRNQSGPKTVVLFDEVNAAPETVMPVLYRLFQERVAGEMSLRDNVHLVAAGNPGSAMSAGRDVQPVLRRRFVWLNLVNDLESWSSWAAANGVDARVIAFLTNPNFRQHSSNFDPKARGKLTYATWDSWTKLARGLSKVLDAFSDKADREVQFAGYVGQEAATAFNGYIELGKDMVSAEDVLRDPRNARLPDSQDALWLLLGGIINLAEEKPQLARGGIIVAQRILEGGKYADFGAFIARSLSRRPALKKTLSRAPEVLQFAKAIRENHTELLAALTSLNAEAA